MSSLRSLGLAKCMCTFGRLPTQATGRLWSGSVACYVFSLWSLVEPPDLHLVHFGRQEILSRIASMEPEYDEKLVWVEPAPANLDDAARPRDQAADESPWGEGIKVYGDARPLKGRLTPSLMADGYGFGSQEELLRTQKYLCDHGNWQLEQVGNRRKRLWSLVVYFHISHWSLG